MHQSHLHECCTAFRAAWQWVRAHHRRGPTSCLRGGTGRDTRPEAEWPMMQTTKSPAIQVLLREASPGISASTKRRSLPRCSSGPCPRRPLRRLWGRRHQIQENKGSLEPMIGTRLSHFEAHRRQTHARERHSSMATGDNHHLTAATPRGRPRPTRSSPRQLRIRQSPIASLAR